VGACLQSEHDRGDTVELRGPEEGVEGKQHKCTTEATSPTRGDGGEGHVFKPAAPWSSRPPPCCVLLTACGARGLRPALRACAAGVASSRLVGNAVCVHGQRVGRRVEWPAGVGTGQASGRLSRARHAESARGRRGGLHDERRPSRTWDAASARRHRGGRRSERARPAWRGRGQRGGRRGHRARRAGGRRGHGMRRECAAGAKVGTATMGLLRSGALPQHGTSGPSKEARMATRSRRTAGWQVAMPCSALFLQLARVPGQPALVVVGRPH